MLKSLNGIFDYELLTLEFLVNENSMISYLKTIQNIVTTFLAVSHVSDRCLLEYLFSLSLNGSSLGGGFLLCNLRLD